MALQSKIPALVLATLTHTNCKEVMFDFNSINMMAKSLILKAYSLWFQTQAEIAPLSPFSQQ